MIENNEFIAPADPSVLDGHALAMKKWIEEAVHCPHFLLKDLPRKEPIDPDIVYFDPAEPELCAVHTNQVHWCKKADMPCLVKNCPLCKPLEQ